MARATQSAFIATPAFYKIADQFGSMVDGLSNSSSLNVLTDQMGKQLKLGDKMNGPNGVLTGIQNSLEGILLGGIMASYFSGTNDPISKIARSAAQQELIKSFLESKTKIIEHRLQMVAKALYENALQDEISKQENKLGGSDMASASGYSEEKVSAMENLAYTVVMEPDDLEINA